MTCLPWLDTLTTGLPQPRVEDWKRVARSDESRFRLLNANRRLRIWRQAHEAMAIACQVGTVQRLGGSIMVWGTFRGTVWDLWTATAGSDVVQSGRPIFDYFFQHLWPYIGNNTANVVFQMVKRLWLIRIDQ
ncbi:uncharacterized protein TNCV_257961 [Trichonephila clavipes]|uniref:Uncharacterized protein n=1 Tax=Trichonephila clavipes TaxID=2585209 RepID=A0A8X6RV88_TRICX|nr:uncharacterized protein TNCV_257961 [Trichonephila clavipes]